ncbi:hypothetical protein Tery_1888 [Trichodesmium erythraeum IMS101]|uniref:Uncharacterized protein n=1 Tax=Trichodesmium erythraeum (strain IMS101) TaxID=203124 RepID=Q114D0_TRIEI|nr:hypothetical protein [Trichodesmium erythraeum GBRTRLIN201]MCH2049790.1 hypothetical protein [Trichodesmium sp. ALOHA_ZT_67]MDE5095972.1 hypothetical protein [Trichodesmium sp. St11_bin5]MDT9341435.1 hypothetical protein [Trichodesmium erythraeum 21-75]
MDKPSTSTGLITGLVATLFFSISFSLLEYTIKSSIILGFIGGISAGLLGFWSQIESRPETPEKADAKSVDSIKLSKSTSVIKPRLQTPKERSGVSVLSWLFKQK